MDIDDSKQVCGICNNWGGKRECVNGLVKVKPSIKGQCAILNKPKPPHGGCGKWEKWDSCFSS
jgi:hypothetical protein